LWELSPGCICYCDIFEQSVYQLNTIDNLETYKYTVYQNILASLHISKEKKVLLQFIYTKTKVVSTRELWKEEEGVKVNLFLANSDFIIIFRKNTQSE